MSEVNVILNELLEEKRKKYIEIENKATFLSLYQSKQEEMDNIKDFSVETVIDITNIMLDMGAITSCYFDKFNSKLVNEAQGW